MERDFFDLANQVLGTLYSIRAMAQEWPPQAATPAQQINVEYQRQQHTKTLDEMIDKLGWPPMLGSKGQVIQAGAGLLGEAADSFRQMEEKLRPVHLHLVTQAFKATGYPPERYAWPVLLKVSLATVRWAMDLHDFWAGFEKQTFDLRQRWLEAIDQCPLSDELLEEIGWRLVQERDWLDLQKPEEPDNKGEGGPKRGGNNRGSDAMQRVAHAIALHHGYDPEARNPSERFANRTPATVEQITKLASVSVGTVSNWMRQNFGNHKRYCQKFRCASETGYHNLIEIFERILPKPKRHRILTEGELTFQAKAVAPVQLTEEEAFATARQHADESGIDISDEELRNRVRQAMQVS